MFITALVITTAKIWKQLGWPSIGAWTDKLQYTQTMEYFSVLIRNELSIHVKRHEGILKAYD